MNSAEDIKKVVKEKYSQIALQERSVNAASCCGATPASDGTYTIMSDDYSALQGYNAEADLGLGCGLPTQFAKIQKGDTVIDLGSGAGNDCFVARNETGAEGKVIGIDFSEAMLNKARQNVEKLGFNNVEFRSGDIENMPVSDAVADVVVSNCVLNLVPNKEAVMKEMFRVIKPGGHFSVSDIVLLGQLPEPLQKDAEMYAGCVSGAIQKEDYLHFIKKAGFTDVIIQKEKPILLPDDILRKYLDESDLAAFKKGSVGIFSITVFGKKPGIKPVKAAFGEEGEACLPGSGCC